MITPEQRQDAIAVLRRPLYRYGSDLEKAEALAALFPNESYKERKAIVEEAKQRPVKAAAPKKKSRSKRAGNFTVRRLRKYPDYVIDENGTTVGPAGTVLKFRWNGGKPYVKIGGKDRSVYWLLVDAGFEEHPAEKKERRAKAKADKNPVRAALKCYNDTAEALGEDPEMFGAQDDPTQLSPDLGGK